MEEFHGLNQLGRSQVGSKDLCVATFKDCLLSGARITLVDELLIHALVERTQSEVKQSLGKTLLLTDPPSSPTQLLFHTVGCTTTVAL